MDQLDSGTESGSFGIPLVAAGVADPLVFWNTKIESPRITREMIDREAETEVIFEGQTSSVVATDDSSQKYQWTCDTCGHQWEDDGIVREE